MLGALDHGSEPAKCSPDLYATWLAAYITAGIIIAEKMDGVTADKIVRAVTRCTGREMGPAVEGAIDDAISGLFPDDRRWATCASPTIRQAAAALGPMWFALLRGEPFAVRSWKAAWRLAITKNEKAELTICKLFTSPSWGVSRTVSLIADQYTTLEGMTK